MSDFYSDGTGYGGFNATGDGGNSQQNTGRTYAKQQLTPVTMKMIDDALIGNDGTFTSNGIDLTTVRVMGCVRTIDPQQSYDMYEIEDGTHSLKTRVWTNKDDASSGGFEQPSILVGDWVELVASLRDFQGKIQTHVQVIRKVEDFNAIPYHFLNVTANWLQQTGKLGASEAKPQVGGDPLFVQQDSLGATAGSASGKVLQFIQDSSKQMSEGVPIGYIRDNLRLDPHDIQTAIDELVNDGIIFTSSDEDHYLPV